MTSSAISPSISRAGLSSHLLSSSTGKVIQAVDSLAGILGEIDLSLPDIVVIGEESSGKSSVLERIAMLPAFPRDTNICTRMPIKLCMKHFSERELKDFCSKNNLSFHPGKVYVRCVFEDYETKIKSYYPFVTSASEIESMVKENMNKALERRNGAIIGVVEDVLIVEIMGCIIPTITLIDLPGLVGGSVQGEPQDIGVATENLASKYLRQQHCLVLVVVPATVDRVRNSRAMGLVQKLGKTSQSIGVLTKSDLSYDQRCPTDPYKILKSRLDGSASDLSELENGYVGVKNRDTEFNSSGTLQEAVVSEIKWFNENIPGYIGRGLAGCDSLSGRLCTMLSDYVATVWIPDTVASIRLKRKEVENQLSALGTDPKTPQLLELVLDEVTMKLRTNFNKFGGSLQQICETTLSRCNGTHNNRSDLISFLAGKKSLISEVEKVVSTSLLDEILNACGNVVKSIFGISLIPNMISRFEKLRDSFILEMKKLILGGQEEPIRDVIKTRVVNCVYSILDKDYEPTSGPPLYKRISCQVYHIILEFTIVEVVSSLQTITNILSNRSVYPISTLLSETTSVKLQRIKLNETLRLLNNSETQLKAIVK